MPQTPSLLPGAPSTGFGFPGVPTRPAPPNSPATSILALPCQGPRLCHPKLRAGHPLTLPAGRTLPEKANGFFKVPGMDGLEVRFMMDGLVMGDHGSNPGRLI